MRRNSDKILFQRRHEESGLAQRTGGNFTDRLIMVRVDLLKHIDETIAGSHINSLARWIERHIVNPGADRKILQNFSGVGIQHIQVAVTARGKEPVIFFVHRDRGVDFAIERPDRGHDVHRLVEPDCA